MSLLKDLDEVGDPLKVLLISLLLLPFWYIIFYLFYNDFFIQNSFVTITIFCFAINLVYSIFVILMSARIVALFPPVSLKETIESDGTKKTNADLIIGGMNFFIQLETLSLLIFSVYMCDFVFGKVLYFYSFLIVYFFSLILNLIIVRSQRKKQYQNYHENN